MWTIFFEEKNLVDKIFCLVLCRHKEFRQNIFEKNTKISASKLTLKYEHNLYFLQKIVNFQSY